jgi:hypothetical protein
MSDLATGLSIRSLHPVFVAEIAGVDLTVPVAREDFQTIWDAFNEYHRHGKDAADRGLRHGPRRLSSKGAPP